ncbi:MAG: type II 3-dehydroquinate dehydratase [Gammaproteobacteria bacterium]|jgi:3-dehydroquinate dehydratase-2|nr:type II 3-dehydroquinate dehydratase [Gammaproteobacteria bacterium]|tara:strand:- start:279 stop:722 length:444 start_codon:yes stop_codon:yes gene_type:complete
MNNILLLNGPNLNLLGQREPDIYGNKDLSQIESELKGIALKHGSNLEAFQSNSESDLVNIIQDKSENTDFIIINPGGYTHTSVAIRDAILAVAIPFIEIHISNIHSREEFRKESYFSDIAVGTISGLGFKGYELAALAAIDFLNKKS